MKKGIILSMATASILLLQGCDNTSSKASEKQNTSANTESRNTNEEVELLKKENKDLIKKVTDLESKTNKEQESYTLDEKLAKEIYSIYKGISWNDNILDGGWKFTKESDTKGIITADRGGGQPIYLLSNYAVIFETGLEDSMGQLKIIDLNTKKVIEQYPKHDNNDSKENNKETAQKTSPNTDKEKLKKQLTDGTFIAPKSNAEGRLSISELEMSLKEYLMPKNAKHEDYELDKSEGLPSDDKIVYALRKDNHVGNMAVVGYYALDGNGYIYKYNFVEQKVENTPLTNIYIAGVLPDNKG